MRAAADALAELNQELRGGREKKGDESANQDGVLNKKENTKELGFKYITTLCQVFAGKAPRGIPSTTIPGCNMRKEVL